MAAEKTLEESKRRRRREASADAEPRTGGKGYATPSRRDQNEEPEDTGIVASVTSPLGRFREYLQDVRGELSKVVWPTREEVTRLTRIVLVTLIVSAVIMGVLSFLMSKFVELGLNYPIILFISFVLIVGAAVYGIQNAGPSKRGY
jgi:preprotein translocase subunit SecE